MSAGNPLLRPGARAPLPDPTGSSARLRRALTLVAMTVLLPGSAQRMVGDRRIGRIATLAAVAAVLLGGLLGMLAVWWPQRLVGLLTNDSLLLVLRAALIAYAAGWAVLVLDAWRLSDPLSLDRRHRLWMTGVNAVVCCAVAGSLVFASHLVAVHRDFLSTVFGADDVTAPADGRYNVLLLGGDAGPQRVGMRPDSITVASIDARTGSTVLFGLPRNLADVPFPDGSALQREFPDGFHCEGCYLNGVYTWAQEHPDRFPGIAEPGVAATTDAVEAVTGLTINYHVIVDLKGFAELVDAAGGVTVTVPERLPIGGVGAPITGWIEPGRQHLDGREALWFARSRATTDDYSRMGRQKCLMNAMLRQLDPATVVRNFGDIAAAGKQVLATSIPAGELDTFVGLARKSRTQPIRSVSFVPPRVSTSSPDYALIRSMVARALDGAPPRTEPKPTSGVRRPAGGSPSRPPSANDSPDLGRAC